MEWWKKKGKRARAAAKAKQWKGPVVLPRVIDAFLTRPLDNYQWVKSVAQPDLDEELEGFTFHGNPPLLHQKACLLLGSQLPHFLFLLDMGAGKSKIVLDVFRHRKARGLVKKMLVLVPAEVNTEGWLEQLSIHAPDLKGLALTGTWQSRTELVEREADVYLLNYDGLMSFMTRMGKVKGKGREIYRPLAKQFAGMFGMVVFDESHLIGNKASLRFRMCNVLSSEIPYRYGMTGTPFGRDPEMLWSQFFLVDRGETLGTTLGMYRAAFFNAEENYWGGYKYKFDKTKEELLHQVIQHRSIRYHENEFSDMPKVKRQVHRLSFPISTEEYYVRVLKELREAKGDLQAQENAFIRMRQVCSGFLTVRDEDDEKVEVRFYTNPKLEELETLIDSVIEEEKVIVFHEFVLSGTMIAEMLDRKKIKWARVGGKVKKPIEQMRKFMDKKDCRVLLFNNHSPAGAGLNLQNVCKRLIYYESPVSPIKRKQTEKRISGGLRTGKHRTFIHDLAIAKSVDEMVLGFLKQGKDLFEAICEGKAKLEGG